MWLRHNAAWPIEGEGRGVFVCYVPGTCDFIEVLAGTYPGYLSAQNTSIPRIE